MKKLFTYIGCMLLTTVASSQISLPGGNTVNVLSGEMPMYIETDIPFYTGSNKINGYKWQRLYDSAHAGWSFMACMNGECILNLPDTGTFKTDFGINDTTGYMRFHVFSDYKNGSAVIKYRIYNGLNPADEAILTFNITYDKALGISGLSEKNVSIYPNPAAETINISGENISAVGIYNMLGKQVLFQNTTGTNTGIQVTGLPGGVYILAAFLQTGECINRKINIEH